MLVESKKLNIIEKVLLIDSESELDALTLWLDRSQRPSETPPVTKPGFADFFGIWTAGEAGEIEKAIQEGCEKINADDWK